MLFLPDLVIYALEDSFFTRKRHRETRLTKSKETVPGRRPESPSIPIVISPDFILHIIPRLIGPVGKESLLTLLNRVPSRPCRIYQELLHSSSRYNATVTGEKNRPCSGLARVSAHPRPPKIRKPSATASRFPDWIGGMCYADTLQVWFPAHWAFLVIRQL